VAKSLKPALLLVLIALTVILVGQPVAPARGQSLTPETEQQFTSTLPVGYYNATAITVAAPSIIGYATNSNVSIYTAFMDQQEFGIFRATGDITNSIFYQGGPKLYDALLEGAGTYYLVEYAYASPAEIIGLYIVNPNVDLRNSTTSVGELVTIQPGQVFTLPLHIETLGSTTQVDIVGASTRIVQYALLDQTTNTVVFTSPSVTITNFTVYPTVSIGYNMTLDPGQYVMGITDQSPVAAYVYFSYTLIPAFVNPFLLNFGSPSPTGIAAYGIYNSSGTITPYRIDTTSIVGYADIRTLQATDNQSGSHQSSLQENTVLEVNNTDGAVFTYWPQNVLAFDSGASTVTYRNNVLNTTGDGAELTNQTILGTGTTSVDNNHGVIQTYYGNYNSNYTYTYTLPQAWVLYMNETVEQGTGVVISMGVRALDGPTPEKITWFDRITIVDPNVASADFVVDGREYTPAGADTSIGSFFDAELVFGGGAGGQAATYSLDASLALFYWDQTMKPFPSLYTFGDDTAEAAFNIDVSNGNGVATAQSGTPYYGVLTNDFNSSFASLVAGPRSQSAGTSYLGYVAAGALIAAVLVVAFIMLVRRRGRGGLVHEATPTVSAPARFCGNCGSALERDAAFCPNCGSQQLAEDPTQGNSS
jgi:thermopsin